ncbi:hypothetical protein F4818DRAFT_428448 [Hypoxylon cercidicola]|nr:hypothetical protein F4818DRAFT_428448 [Hypoxylon cercidicola]
MADLMRISRPWLLSPQHWRAPSPILCGLYRTISTTAPRPYAAKKGPKSKTWRSRSGTRKQDGLAQAQANMTLLLPETLVAPPLSRYPLHPAKFVQMLWLHLRARAQSLWAVVSMKVTSQPKIFVSKPLFQFRKSAAIPTAKALHAQMSSAMAMGDKDVLRQICTPELFLTLATTVDSRPKGTRVEWELVKYDKRWRYPRIADWRVGYQPLHDGGMKLIKQVVVSIASVQRITRYDDANGGVKVPGSERVRHMIEHMVLQAEVDTVTYEARPWRIWGTLSEATFESYKTEVENIRAIMLEQSKAS